MILFSLSKGITDGERTPVCELSRPSRTLENLKNQIWILIFARCERRIPFCTRHHGRDQRTSQWIPPLCRLHHHDYLAGIALLATSYYAHNFTVNLEFEIRAPPGARALNLSSFKNLCQCVCASVRPSVRPPVITHGVLIACNIHLIAGVAG